MSFAKVSSAQTSLLKAHIVDIEVDLSKGLQAFSVVGLPDKAIEESKDRISAAIKNSGFKSPKGTNQKIVISLAPADLKKEGPIFDLGMALAYLLASEEIKFDPKGQIFLGELSLDGEVRSIKGTLPLIKEAKARGFSEAFVPRENAKEAALISGIKIYGVKNLKEIISHLNEKKTSPDLPEIGSGKNVPAFAGESAGKISAKIPLQKKTEVEYSEPEYKIDFSDVKGQESAKRGLEIAAAGGHNLAMYGPPGTGKTMLAKAFCGILPPLSFDDILETTSIHSIAGTLKDDLVTWSPFRAPHHTSSYVSIVGGGTFPKPGEITLAHKGVLFLDEFPEFDRRVIDSLRQPLEERFISVSRAKGSVNFPANFILIAAMNPCPCGNYGFKGRECVCSPINLVKYKRKISGPIIDRIDMWIEVGRVDTSKLSDEKIISEPSKTIRDRVKKARKIQEDRFKKYGIKAQTNGEMGVRDLVKCVFLESDAKNTLNKSAEYFGLSARAYHRIIKLARTISDLAGSERVKNEHILEALQYRPKKQSS